MCLVNKVISQCRQQRSNEQIARHRTGNTLIVWTEAFTETTGAKSAWYILVPRRQPRSGLGRKRELGRTHHCGTHPLPRAARTCIRLQAGVVLLGCESQSMWTDRRISAAMAPKPRCSRSWEPYPRNAAGHTKSAWKIQAGHVLPHKACIIIVHSV